MTGIYIFGQPFGQSLSAMRKQLVKDDNDDNNSKNPKQSKTWPYRCNKWPVIEKKKKKKKTKKKKKKVKEADESNRSTAIFLVTVMAVSFTGWNRRSCDYV